MLYDEIIRKEITLVMEQESQLKRLPVSMKRDVWKDSGKNGIVLKPDMQCELGGGNLKAVGNQMVTTDKGLVPADELALIGPDLPELAGNRPYARIAWILLDEQAAVRERDLYDMIRAVEYTRYRVNPYGYMQRISLSGHREPVRISRQAVQEGLTFAEVGSLYLQAYHQNPYVKAVRMLFFTDPDTDYEELERDAERTESLTKALDHVLKDVRMNCSSCTLKEICDEVEELKVLHFQNIK